MPTLTFYSTDAGNGECYRNGTSWSNSRSGAGTGHGHGAGASDTIGGSYNNGSNSKYTYRGFFPFNITGIPAGATITSAVFSVYIDTIVGSPSLGLILTTQADVAILANTDYSALTLDTPPEGATRVSASLNQYNDFTLNATGLLWLPTPGTDAYVKLGTREARDIDNGLDDTNTYANGRFNDYAGTNYDPKLVITYTPFVASSSKFFSFFN